MTKPEFKLEYDPKDYRKCSQVCRAEIGEPCFSLSGTITGGRPDGVRTYLPLPHKARKRRTRTPAYTTAPKAK